MLKEIKDAGFQKTNAMRGSGDVAISAARQVLITLDAEGAMLKEPEYTQFLIEIQSWVSDQLTAIQQGAATDRL